MNDRKKEYPLKAVSEKKIERITFLKLAKDVGEVVNLERGILYLIRELILRPGETIRSYLYENRMSLFHPVRFLFVTTAFSFFIFWLFDGAQSISEIIDLSQPQNPDTETILDAELTARLFTEIFNDYFNLMIWLFVPVISLFSYLLFRKAGYNYAENLVLNTFITGVSNIFTTLGYLMEYGFGIMYFSVITSLFYVGYNVVVYHRFFRYPSASVVRSLVAIFLGYLLYILVFSFVIGIIVGTKVARLS